MPPIKKPPRKRSRHFIQDWRLHRQIKPPRAAEALHMTRENYGKLERGEIPYNQDTLEILAELYRCTPGDLVDRRPQDDAHLRPLLNALRTVPPEDREQMEIALEAMLKLAS